MSDRPSTDHWQKDTRDWTEDDWEAEEALWEWEWKMEREREVGFGPYEGKGA